MRHLDCAWGSSAFRGWAGKDKPVKKTEMEQPEGYVGDKENIFEAKQRKCVWRRELISGVIGC